MASSITENDLLLWVDLETTGDDPKVDRIIEAAMLFTDTKGNPCLNVIWNETKKINGFELDQIMSNDIVFDMHTKSGLLEDSIFGPDTLDNGDFRRGLKSYIISNIEFCRRAYPDSKVYLAGSGVHFDKSFLYRDFPDLFSRGFLHYSVMDISPMRKIVAILDLEPYEHPEGLMAHRAVNDIQDHLAEYRYYLELFNG